MVFRESKN